MRFGHLDPGPRVLLQLRYGLTTLADDGAGHHRRHQHLEVVRRLHRCKSRIIYTELQHPSAAARETVRPALRGLFKVISLETKNSLVDLT